METEWRKVAKRGHSLPVSGGREMSGKNAAAGSFWKMKWCDCLVGGELKDLHWMEKPVVGPSEKESF